MNLISVIILAVIVFLLVLAVRYTIRHKGCAECDGSCVLPGSCSRNNKYASRDGDTRINFHVYKKTK